MLPPVLTVSVISMELFVQHIFFFLFFFCGSRSTTNHLFCSEALSLVINIMHAYLLVDMLSHLLQ